MYSTGILLLVGTIPVTIAFAFLHYMTLNDSSMALTFGLCIMTSQLFIGGGSLCAAMWVTKRRKSLAKRH